MSGVRARLETEELHAVRCVRYVYVAVHGSLGCHLGVSFCYESCTKLAPSCKQVRGWYKVGAKQVRSCYEVANIGTKLLRSWSTSEDVLLVTQRARCPVQQEDLFSCRPP